MVVAFEMAAAAQQGQVTPFGMLHYGYGRVLAVRCGYGRRFRGACIVPVLLPRQWPSRRQFA